MENYVKNVELVSEKERAKARLCPRTGEGITKRILVNVKVDTINWMVSKMAVRKYLLPNTKNQHVMEMLSSTLWDPDIFSDEAFVKMRTTAIGLGRKLEALLGIQGTMPKELLNWPAPSTSANSNPRPYEPPQKKFKPNPQMPVPNIPQPQQKYNKRGNRSGTKNNNKGNNKKNNGYGNNRQNQNKPNQNRNNNQGKSFHKGKRESNK